MKSVLVFLLLLGYVRSTSSAGEVTVWPRATFEVDVGARLPSGVSRATLLQAVRGAARAWSDVDCASVRIAVKDVANQQLPVADDGINAMVVHVVSWCADERGRDCHDSMTPALTTTRFTPAAVPGRVSIREADIEINAVDYRWDDLTLRNGADLQGIITHEVGHALGLADNCLMPGLPIAFDDAGKPVPDCTLSPPELRNSVMWPLGLASDARRRSLSAQDRRAICALYPRSVKRR